MSPQKKDTRQKQNCTDQSSKQLESKAQKRKNFLQKQTRGACAPKYRAGIRCLFQRKTAQVQEYWWRALPHAVALERCGDDKLLNEIWIGGSLDFKVGVFPGL